MAGGEHDAEPFKVLDVQFEGLHAVLLVILLFIFLTVIARILFHHQSRLPESTLIISLGVLLGIVVNLLEFDLTQIPGDLFFLVLIPPIILEAGYFLKKGFFFANIATILLYAFFGTLLNALLTGTSIYLLCLSGAIGVNLSFMRAMIFGSLISAVDPVAVLAIFESVHINDTLHMLVFGESVLNDAVSIVLYQLFVRLSQTPEIDGVVVVLASVRFFVVGLGGVVMGVFWGLLSSYMTLFTEFIPVIEPLIILVCALLSYLMSETFHLSGIVAILFCGITMSHYTERNITQKSHTTIKYGMKVIAGLAETLIFMYLGLSTTAVRHVVDWGFMVLALVCCEVYRAMSVVGLTWVSNRRRLVKIPWVEQVIMWYGGLRGAIAFLLAWIIPHGTPGREEIVSTTLFICLFTVFFQGGTVKPLITKLHVARSNHKRRSERSLSSYVFPKAFPMLTEAVGLISGATESRFQEFWQTLDRGMLQKYFVREDHRIDEELQQALHTQFLREAAVQERSSLKHLDDPFIMATRIDSRQGTPVELQKPQAGRPVQRGGSFQEGLTLLMVDDDDSAFELEGPQMHVARTTASPQPRPDSSTSNRSTSPQSSVVSYMRRHESILGLPKYLQSEKMQGMSPLRQALEKRKVQEKPVPSSASMLPIDFMNAQPRAEVFGRRFQESHPDPSFQALEILVGHSERRKHKHKGSSRPRSGSRHSSGHRHKRHIFRETSEEDLQLTPLPEAGDSDTIMVQLQAPSTPDMGKIVKGLEDSVELDEMAVADALHDDA